jgi:hypothetical protein
MKEVSNVSRESAWLPLGDIVGAVVRGVRGAVDGPGSGPSQEERHKR